MWPRIPLVLALLALLIWGPLPLVARAPSTLGCGPTEVDPLGLLRFVASGQQLDPATPPGENSLRGRLVAIIIDAQLRRLFVMVDGQVYRQFPVAVGTPENPSPIGHWRIVEKDAWGGGFGARWMQLSVPWGTFGIHGTNNPGSIGTRASHGCIRMFNRDVKVLYDLVEVGTPVTIRGRPTARFGEVRRDVCPVNLGTDIWEMQKRLAELRLYTGPLDGRFGSGTTEALKAFQAEHGLSSERGCLGPRSYDALGLKPYSEDPDLSPGQLPPGAAP